ncbi:MAG: glutathione S-transferase family protein, partial [Mesorhizobium sp.]
VRYAQAIEDGEKPAGSGVCLGHIPLAEVIDRIGA